MAFTKRIAGGKDRFTWEEVKVDKDRENYLGHSVMAPVGRWQKGKDLQWYAKGPQGKGGVAKKPPLDMELAAVRQQEEEAMAVALYVVRFSLLFPQKCTPWFQPGIRKPSVARLGTKSLSKQEIAEICKRETAEDDEVPDEKQEVHRMQGLGYRNHRLAVLMSGNTVEKESLKGTGQQPIPTTSVTTTNNVTSSSGQVMPSPPSQVIYKDKEDHSSKKKKKHKKSSKHKSRKHHVDSSSDERHKRKSKKVKKLKETKKSRHDSDSD